MNKNNEVRGRGRPRKELNYPKFGPFTVNTLVGLNPKIECRLSLYTRVNELVAKRVLRYTGETQALKDGPGKPLDIFESMASYRKRKAAKAAAKARKLTKITVDLTPAPVSVSVPVPVTVVS